MDFFITVTLRHFAEFQSLAALCLSAKQFALDVDLTLKINLNIQNVETFLENGEDEWSVLWKSIHQSWVIT